MSVLVQNVKLTDSRRELKGELLIGDDGYIAEVGTRLKKEVNTVIDGRGKTLMPAFVDLHAHFRDPGLTHKEDIASGCRAAVRGGYTTVNLMANTSPVCSSMEVVQYVRDLARQENLCDVYQTASVTKDFDGKTLSHIHVLDDSVHWLSDDGFGVKDTGVMLEAMHLAAKRGMGLMLHEEDPALSEECQYLAENLMTFRDVKLAFFTGCRVHICHVSTIDALNHIMAAKLKCSHITCEVTPHHIALNSETNYNVAPPLRREAHRQYLIAGIQKGIVDAIATDHAPHTPEDKANGANGITGLDLAFATCYTALVREGLIPLRELSRLLSYGPAVILGVHKGQLKEGYPADLVLVDEDKSFVVKENMLASKSKNTPMLGKTLYGEVLWTMKKGELVYENADWKAL